MFEWTKGVVLTLKLSLVWKKKSQVDKNTNLTLGFVLYDSST